MRTIPIAEDVASKFNINAHLNLTRGTLSHRILGRKYVTVIDNIRGEKVMDLDPSEARTLAEALLTAASVAEAQTCPTTNSKRR